MTDMPPTWRARLVVAAVIAVVAGIYTYLQHRYFLNVGAAPDSIVMWRAARILLDGDNPWRAAEWGAAGARYLAEDPAWRIRMTEPLYYPLPAVLPWLVVAKVPFLWASVLFNTVGALAFAYAVTRAGLHRAWLCGSIGFFIAMRFGQWAPLLVAASLMPTLSGLLVVKPNIGLPLWLSWPTWSSSLACALLLVVPTLWMPEWAGAWWQNVTTEMGRATPHPAPVTMFHGAGAVFLLGLLRWRQQEARLLVALACMPQLPYWADQLPLVLAAKTRREVIAFTLVTLLGMTLWLGVFVGRGDPVDTMRPIATLCTYGPALLLILRRPNDGALPPMVQWLRDRFTGRAGERRA